MKIKALLAALIGATALLTAPASEAQAVATSGPYEITLTASRFHAREASHLEFRLVDRSRRDAAGQASAVEQANLRGVITMPAMPGMAAVEQLAHTEGAPGVYGVHADFPHGGEYRLALTLNVRRPGSMFGIDSFAFQFPITVLEPDPTRASEGRIRTYSLEIERPAGPFRAGQPAELRMKVLREADPEKSEGAVTLRRRVPVTDFEMRHEKRMHLFVVRDDLGEFAHEHPEIARDGTASLPYTFPSAGRYRVFADVAPRGAGGQVVDATVEVAGPPPRPYVLGAEPRLAPGDRSTLGDLIAEWTFDGTLPAKRMTLLTATVRDRLGRPVTDLEPYLGAGGHLMLVHEDGRTLVHAHPKDGDAPAPGTVRFVAWVPKAGLYRGWAQFQRAGAVLTTSFVVRAE